MSFLVKLYEALEFIPAVRKLQKWLRTRANRKNFPRTLQKLRWDEIEKKETNLVLKDQTKVLDLTLFTNILQFNLSDKLNPKIPIVTKKLKPNTITIDDHTISDQESNRVEINNGVFVINQKSSNKIIFRYAENSLEIDLIHDFNFMFGLGEKHGSLNKIDREWEFWNIDAADFEPGDDPLYKSYPVAIFFDGEEALGIVNDFPGYQKWKVNGEVLNIRLYGKSTNLCIIQTENLQQMMQTLANLLGHLPLPPLWAMGYHQCRYSYYPQSRVIQIANQFRSRDIPIDVIYLDIHYMDNFKCFTWDKNRFPDPQSMINELHDKGISIVSIIDPGIKSDEDYEVYQSGVDQNIFSKKDGKNYIAPVWPGDCVFPDFYNSSVREWWGDQYQDLIKLGIDGFWNDMNEPATFTFKRTFEDSVMHKFDTNKFQHLQLHNLYGQKMVQGTSEGMKKWSPNKRQFILSRSAYLGSQKYGWTWTGDNRSSWDHLRASIPKILSMGISGHGMTGADIGGFRGNPTAELYARWIELGSLYPLSRTHTAVRTKNQEPWSYGNEVEWIARKFITLRYKLLPYIYTWTYKVHKDGIPLWRPLFYEFPKQSNSYLSEWNTTQFFLGPNLLVAPILEEGSTERNIWLPPGIWHDFFSDEKMAGGTHEIHAELDAMPIFVKDNSIIPVAKNPKINAEITMNGGIEFIKYGDNSEGFLYLDDFNSLRYLDGDFGFYKITSDDSLELLEGSGIDYNNFFT